MRSSITSSDLALLHGLGAAMFLAIAAMNSGCAMDYRVGRLGDQGDAPAVDGSAEIEENNSINQYGVLVFNECEPTGDEYCDGVDNDCDGVTDEGDALDATFWYFDADADGYGDHNDWVTACAPPLDYVADATDCDDDLDTVYPGAPEVCDWIVDNSCDGVPDLGELDGSYDANGDGDLNDEGDITEHGGPDGYTWCYQYYDQVDEDRDGYCSSGQDINGDGDCTDASDILFPSDQSCPWGYHDCDVTDASVFPDAAELDDGLDNNCDGVVDNF